MLSADLLRRPFYMQIDLFWPADNFALQTQRGRSCVAVPLAMLSGVPTPVAKCALSDRRGVLLQFRRHGVIPPV